MRSEKCYGNGIQDMIKASMCDVESMDRCLSHVLCHRQISAVRAGGV